LRSGEAAVIAPTPPLSRVRTFLLVGLAVVWFCEGVLTGVQPLAEGWTRFWKMFPPENPTLAAALYTTHAFEAPLKAGLLVLALAALRSGRPSVRTPLFVSMSLVPPINVAFHFRAQGFPLVPTIIGTTLSAILWGSILWTSEPAEPVLSHPAGHGNVIGRVWFALSAAVLTLLGLVYLLAPRVALYGVFPCLSNVFDAEPGELESLTVSTLAAGSHLTALATASWFATARYPTSPPLRQAMAVSMLTMTALMCILPLRQVVQRDGWTCARSPILIAFVVLLLGWAAYATSNRTRRDR